MRLLLTLGLLILIFVFCSCGGHQEVETPNHDTAYIDKVAETKYKSTVRIVILCPGTVVGYGAGVVVDTRLVYTAKHVIKCPDGSSPRLIVAIDYNENKIALQEYWEDPERDLAALKTKEHVFDVHAHYSRRPPKLGENVCMVGGGTQDVFISVEKCGKVYKVTGDMFGAGILTVQGNSGGPVFDSLGGLLGLTVEGHNSDASGNFIMFTGFPVREN